ncbi:MAG TPA: TetR family transcriptional regulator [Bryobacteraceae bacterium]|nr:TetR family transcriptional regulator [Bryobacteraceae bacterium]
MAEKRCTLDPRIRRTRQLLQQALEKLLETKGFDEISVLDITGAATVNRATFYDHYVDKYALLECLVAGRFHELLAQREVQFDGTCGSALRAIALAVCDYLVRLLGPDGSRQPEPHMESAIIGVVRRILLEGLERRPRESGIPPEIVAATASWAIYGASKEWAQVRDRCPADEIATTIMSLVSPILRLTATETHAPTEAPRPPAPERQD